MELSKIQPSQLYISEVKLEKVRTFFRKIDHRSLDPLPVKRIGNTTFLTDGHTRAFALFERGISEVKVYLDEDDLDWLQYLICVGWCQELGIRQISDLHDRVVDHSTYRRLWHKRCDHMQKAVQEGNYEGVSITRVTNPREKSQICEEVLRALPQWFGIEEATRSYILGVAQTDFFVIRLGPLAIGFISLVHHNEFTSEIYCMGLFQEVHGRGLGKQLLNEAENFLKGQRKKFLTVKTLGDSFPDPGYERTKQFYRAVGFIPLEESTEIWGPQVPCLFMVKVLSQGAIE